MPEQAEYFQCIRSCRLCRSCGLCAFDIRRLAIQLRYLSISFEPFPKIEKQTLNVWANILIWSSFGCQNYFKMIEWKQTNKQNEQALDGEKNCNRL